VARGIRLTKAERVWLKAHLHDPCNDYGWDAKDARLAGSITQKLDASEEAPKGVAIEPIEEALIASARGKVVALEAGHARASVQAKAVGATPETARKVGEWMARQGWLQGPQTIIDVLNKWFQWLPKAKATEPPPALQAGLGAPGAPKAGFR
jgi:hypothetical protein